MKQLALLLVLFLTGCASVPMYEDSCKYLLGPISECREDPEEITLPTYVQLQRIPPAKDKVVVAVYNFNDLTGQRKSKDNIASFSTAVTQGGTEMLIDALKTAGKGSWFRVVERAGIDNLVRERQIIRSTRYRRDVVSVSLRGISTLTGEVLLNVQSKKTILSYGEGFDVFRFIDMDTELIEYEDGVAKNESVTYATRAAIEAAVVAFIKQGDQRGYWEVQWPEGEVSE